MFLKSVQWAGQYQLPYLVLQAVKLLRHISAITVGLRGNNHAFSEFYFYIYKEKLRIRKLEFLQYIFYLCISVKNFSVKSIFSVQST